MAADAGPCHTPAANPDVTDPKEPAAPDSSADSPSQAVAAASIGADPAPPNNRAELISGGNTEKLANISTALPWSSGQHPIARQPAQNATLIRCV